MTPSLMREKPALTLSAIMAGLFALGGVVLGVMADSMMILFDGAYSLISLVLSGLALFTAHMIQKPATRSFPFGFAALQPLTIAVKGITLAMLCLVSLASALHSLFSGGRDTDVTLALAFAVISTVVCGIVWVYLRTLHQRIPSDLLDAEAAQWQMDTVLSGAVLLGFVITASLKHTAWAPFAVYGDPVMVVLVSGYFLSVPARMTLKALRELLWAAPEWDLQQRVDEALTAAGLSSDSARQTKIGPYLIVDLDIPAQDALRVSQWRFQLYRQLSDLSVRPVVFFNPERAGSQIGT